MKDSEGAGGLDSASTGPAPARHPPGPLKELAFVLAMTAALLLAAELAVRALGFHDPEAFGGSRLRYQQIFAPLFLPTKDGRGYRPRDPRLADRSFPRAQAGALRVFVFGESAGAGSAGARTLPSPARWSAASSAQPAAPRRSSIAEWLRSRRGRS